MRGESEIEPQAATLRRFARALVGGDDARQPSLVDDMAAQALHGASGSGRSNAPTKTEVYGALLHANRQRLRTASQLDALVDASGALVASAEFLATYERSRRIAPHARAVQAAVGQMALELKEVLLLVSLAGFTYVEAAQALQTPLATVLLRLTRARDALNEAVSRSTGQPSAPTREPSRAEGRSARGGHLRLVQ